MKLILSLSVLAVALLMVLGGPAPAQADSGIMEDLKTLGSTMKDTVEKAVDNVKTSDIWKWFSDKFSEAKESIKRTFLAETGLAQ